MTDKPKYDPKIHHRKSIRLKGYDYARAGAYFITICCQNMKCTFGNIVGAGFTPAQNNIEHIKPQPKQGVPIAAQMVLNEYGIIAFNEWIKLAERFSNFELDVFQIMPNHMHGIIVLNDAGALHMGAQNDSRDDRAGASPAPTGNIIGAYKSLVSNECLKIYKIKNETMGKLWQRDYYEHIIRNEQSYKNISNYIIHNPEHWKDDKFHR